MPKLTMVTKATDGDELQDDFVIPNYPAGSAFTYDAPVLVNGAGDLHPFRLWVMPDGSVSTKPKISFLMPEEDSTIVAWYGTGYLDGPGDGKDAVEIEAIGIQPYAPAVSFQQPIESVSPPSSRKNGANVVSTASGAVSVTIDTTLQAGEWFYKFGCWVAGCAPASSPDQPTLSLPQHASGFAIAVYGKEVPKKGPETRYDPTRLDPPWRMKLEELLRLREASRTGGGIG